MGVDVGGTGSGVLVAVGVGVKVGVGVGLGVGVGVGGGVSSIVATKRVKMARWGWRRPICRRSVPQKEVRPWQGRP